MSKQADVLARLADAIERQNVLVAEQLRAERLRTLSRPEIDAEIVARRKPLRPFSPQALLRAAPFAYAEAFNAKVPGDFLTIREDHIGVRCPCGDEHRVGHEGYPCGAPCGRYFLFDGADVLVASSSRPES